MELIESGGDYSPPQKERPALSSGRRGDYMSDDMNENNSFRPQAPITSGRKGNYESGEMDEVSNRNKSQLADPPMTSGRKGNFNPDEMDENNLRVNPQTFDAPLTSGRRGNYQASDFDERTPGEVNLAYYADQSNDPEYVTVRIDNDNDGYLSKDMNEKTLKQNKDSSRVLHSEKNQPQPTITSPLTNTKMITSDPIQSKLREDSGKNEKPILNSLSSRAKAGYNSAEMSEGHF